MVTKKAWLIFRDTDLMWCKGFRKGFGHMMLLQNDGFNWFIFDPRNRSLSFTILPTRPEENLPRYLKKHYDYHILEVTYMPSTRRASFFNILKLVHCVTIVKYILGISFPGFTPYGVYSNLLKMKKSQLYTHGVRGISLLI